MISWCHVWLLRHDGKKGRKLASRLALGAICYFFFSMGGFLGNEREGQGEVITGCWFLRFMFYLGAKNKL